MRCVELSVIARIFGVTPPAVSRWVKKGGRAALSEMRRRGQQPPAAVIAYAEMWTYRQMRHGEQRRDLWLGTTVLAEPDGRRGADFEVGGRSANTFQQLYARRPEAELYRNGAYMVYQGGLTPGSYVVGNRARGTGTRALIGISIGMAAGGLDLKTQ